jgi:hypothetical protein
MAMQDQANSTPRPKRECPGTKGQSRRRPKHVWSIQTSIINFSITSSVNSSLPRHLGFLCRQQYRFG